MKRFLTSMFVLVVVCGLILSGCAGTASPPASSEPASTPTSSGPVVLRWAMVMPPTDNNIIQAQALAERFNERTGGKYTIEVFPGETLLKIPEALDAVRTGVVEISWLPFGIFAGADARFDLTNLPFLYDNLEACVATQESLKELYTPVFEKFNQTPLYFAASPPWQLISTKPVETLDDLKGLLTQVTSPPQAVLVESWGSAPVIISMPEAYDSLQKGVVDACIVNSETAFTEKLYEAAPYVTIGDFIIVNMGSTINLDVLNSLPADVKVILLEEFQQMMQTLNNEIVDKNHEYLASLADVCKDVYTLPDAEREKWKDAYLPNLESALTKAGEFGQQVRQIAEKANSQNP